jgi:hypothetical protein
MLKLAALTLLLAATPALAAAPVDRATAVSALAGFYYSADACSLQISRVKVDAYAEANRPANDALFNVDVFRATQALYAAHKDWSKDQLDAYCKTARQAVVQLGVTL